MSSGGYFRVQRAIFKHEFFRKKEFSDREAFLWLLSEAAWKSRGRRIGQFFVELNRGELVASLRHLAEAWGWKVGAVRSYLGRLEKERMISTRADNGITIVTVCNYEFYQGDGQDDDTVDSNVPAQPEQGRSKVSAGSEHKTEALNHSSNETGKQGNDLLGDLAPVHSSPPVKKIRKSRSGLPDGLEERFEQFWELCPVKNAKDRALKYYLEIIKAGKASYDLLDQRMIAFRSAEEAKFASGRYREPWQFTVQPVAWLRDGHYGNAIAPIAGSQVRPQQSRADSAIDGMFSDLDQRDFDGRSH